MVHFSLHTVPFIQNTFRQFNRGVFLYTCINMTNEFNMLIFKGGSSGILLQCTVINCLSLAGVHSNTVIVLLQRECTLIIVLPQRECTLRIVLLQRECTLIIVLLQHQCTLIIVLLQRQCTLIIVLLQRQCTLIIVLLQRQCTVIIVLLYSSSAL